MRLLEEYAEKHGLTLTEVFLLGWRKTFGRDCRSNICILDATRYSINGKTPNYMDAFIRSIQKPPIIPEKSSRWQDPSSYQEYKLVDDSPILHARKDIRGIWRV